MYEKCVINVDLVDVFANPDRDSYLHTLAWGDMVEVDRDGAPDGNLKIRTTKFVERPDGSILPEEAHAYIAPKASSGVQIEDVVIPYERSEVLKVNFVDVQQGDGAVIESPDGKIILVDGGDNQMFARYLAARFPGTSDARPKHIDGIVVTHGDADHFSGLTEIHKSERNRNKKKRLFVTVGRVFHNGLVKRPSSAGAKLALGETRTVGGERVLTDLVDDPLKVDDALMNQPFRRWKAALAAWNRRRPFETVRRLAFGDDGAFDFFNRGELSISVLGPFQTERDGVVGLKCLGAPPAVPGRGGSSGYSPSHTINGHSIVLKLSYRGFSYLFAGDLNEEAEETLEEKHDRGEIDLGSHVLKVPHHGSADFSNRFLSKVRPLISVVSSGDESSRKEYIHPRATLMAALGRHSRADAPLVFVTELVAFFKTEGWARLSDERDHAGRGEFFGFSRTAYGIVKTRTDGRRLLVYTDSGKVGLKEYYAFELDGAGDATPSPVVKV